MASTISPKFFSLNPGDIVYEEDEFCGFIIFQQLAYSNGWFVCEKDGKREHKQLTFDISFVTPDEIYEEGSLESPNTSYKKGDILSLVSKYFI